MVKSALFVLFLLPGLAHAAICKTVGEDGVVSFTNVPTIDCPEGSRVPDYSRPAPQAEQANRVDSGITGRQIPFERYRSMEIVSPEDGGGVRSNDGRVPVTVRLEPALQQGHKIVVYLDGRAIPVNFSGTAMELAGVNRGAHSLRAQVRDAGGAILIQSPLVRFTLQQVHAEISVDPITGDDYLDAAEAGGSVTVTGTYSGTGTTGAEKEDVTITLRFPVSENEFTAEMEDGTWEVVVPGQLLAQESSFEAIAQEGSLTFKTTSTHSIDPRVFGGFEGYTPAAGADYTPPKGGISTTPGKTNPAFIAPKGGISATPGQTNPAYTP